MAVGGGAVGVTGGGATATAAVVGTTRAALVGGATIRGFFGIVVATCARRRGGVLILGEGVRAEETLRSLVAPVSSRLTSAERDSRRSEHSHDRRDEERPHASAWSVQRHLRNDGDVVAVGGPISGASRSTSPRPPVVVTLPPRTARTMVARGRPFLGRNGQMGELLDRAVGADPSTVAVEPPIGRLCARCPASAPVGSPLDGVRPPAGASPSSRPPSASWRRRRSRPGPARSTPRHVPAGPLRAVPRHRPARPRDPRGVRRLGRRDPRPHDRDGRGRQVLQHRRADAAAHPPADRAGADRRAARSRSSSTCAASRPARCAPASGCRSRRPAATWSACAPRPCATATTGCSTAPSAGCRASCRPTGTACSPRPVPPTRASTTTSRASSSTARAPGVSVGRTDDKMGVRGVDTGELILDDVRVPGRERRRRGRRLPARDARPQLDAARSSRRAASGSPKAR